MTMNVLEEALSLVEGDRNESYGDPAIKYRIIAKIWSILFQTEITPSQAVIAQIVVKLVRENLKHKRDNIVDLAGYSRILEMVSNSDNQHNEKTNR